MAEYVFEYALNTGDREFQCVMDGDQLATLWDEGIITYNPEIQRGSRKKVLKNGEEKEEAVYSKANVKKIFEAMVSRDYFTNMIALNVLRDGTERLTMNDGSLEVAGQIDIADGQHRVRALSMIRDYNNRGGMFIDLKQYVFPIKITNYDIPTAQKQFHQFSQGLKISSSRSEYFNPVNHTNRVAQALIRDSELAGRVEIIRDSIVKSEKRNILTFSTLVNGITMVYKELSNVRAELLTQYLREFFNELFNVVPELVDYESRQQSKETSLEAENLMFYGYIAISKVLKDKENWQQYLPLINQLDLSKESELWFGKVTKRGRNGLAMVNSLDSRKYLVEKITEQFERLIDNQ